MSYRMLEGALSASNAVGLAALRGSVEQGALIASELAAWASPQSSVVSGRGALDVALANVQRRFAGADVVPVPPHWGGWRIRPDVVEFWQGRADRMHDRLRFKHVLDVWHVARIAP